MLSAYRRQAGQYFHSAAKLRQSLVEW
jgi:hypothetical protein